MKRQKTNKRKNFPVLWKMNKQMKINLKPNYKRTKREAALIKRNPWGDRDGDAVPNWIDCKPFNKKKQGYALREDIAKRLYGDPTLAKTRPQTRRRKRIQRLVSNIVEKEYNDLKESPYKYKKGTIEKIYYKKLPPKMQTKIHTEKDIIKFFEKNPHLIQLAEKYSWELLSPSKTLQVGLHGDFGKPHTVDEALRGKDEQLRIHSVVKGKKTDSAQTIVHELEHGKQRGQRDIYWKEKYGKSIYDVEHELIPKLNIKRKIKLTKAIQSELKDAYKIPELETIYAPISEKHISDFEQVRRETIEEIKNRYEESNKKYPIFSQEEIQIDIDKKLKELDKKIKEKQERSKPYYQIYNPGAKETFTKSFSKEDALIKITDILSKDEEYIPIKYGSDIPYKYRPEEIQANLAAKRYKEDKRTLIGPESPEALINLDNFDDRTKAETHLAVSDPFSDSDGDGVINAEDCKPEDPNRQGYRGKGKKWQGGGWRVTAEEKKEAYRKLRAAGIPVHIAYRVSAWRPTRIDAVIRGKTFGWDLERERQRLVSGGSRTHPTKLEYDKEWRARSHVQEKEKARRSTPEYKKRQKEYNRLYHQERKDAPFTRSEVAAMYVRKENERALALEESRKKSEAMSERAKKRWVEKKANPELYAIKDIKRYLPDLDIEFNEDKNMNMVPDDYEDYESKHFAQDLLDDIEHEKEDKDQ